ncbi:MAG: hypothetical protein ACK4VI_04485 [Alphaproteobacteria bacterium]
MNIITRILCFFSAIILCVAAVSNDCHAQRKTYTGQESGILAFYKLSGLVPDFESWIVESDKYKRLEPADQNQYLDEEMLRYQWLIGTLDPPHHYITIQTEVDAQILWEGEQGAITIDFPGRVSTAGLYFPYNIHDIWVAVIIENIESFMVMPISFMDFNRIRGYLPASETNHKLQLNVVYRGISAQDTPINLDNIQQYIMLGEIAHWSLELPTFHQSHDKILWEYIAPWYRSEHEHDLIQMLEGR